MDKKHNISNEMHVSENKHNDRCDCFRLLFTTKMFWVHLEKTLKTKKKDVFVLLNITRHNSGEREDREKEKDRER